MGNAAQLIVELDSGEIQLFNPTAAAVSIAAYAIESPTNNLNAAAWTPIAGRLDAAGDGSFDGLTNWVVLTPGNPTDEISEGAFEGPGGLLGAGQAVSIGPAWNPGGAQLLSASVVINDVQTILSPSDIIFSPLGDYDWDGDVDNSDYGVFVAAFGSTTDLRADGNNNGVVDAADFTVWRDALGFAAAPAALAASALAVPEPHAAISVAVLLAGAGFMARARAGTR